MQTYNLQTMGVLLVQISSGYSQFSYSGHHEFNLISFDISLNVFQEFNVLIKSCSEIVIEKLKLCLPKTGQSPRQENSEQTNLLKCFYASEILMKGDSQHVSLVLASSRIRLLFCSVGVCSCGIMLFIHCTWKQGICVKERVCSKVK